MAIHDKARTELIRNHQHEYNCWGAMRGRCRYPKNPSWKYYGAKGIRVCDAWEHSFAQFLADVGPAPSWQHSLHRPDSARNYEPGNVCWATPLQQTLDRACVRFITAQGLTICIADWAARSGIDEATIRSRLKAGWTPEEAVTTPSLLRLITAQGQTMWLAAWARQSGISEGTIRSRIQKGWTPAEAVTIPSRSRRRRR